MIWVGWLFLNVLYVNRLCIVRNNIEEHSVVTIMHPAQAPDPYVSNHGKFI